MTNVVTRLEDVAVQDFEAPKGVEEALAPARRAAFGPGEFVGQESFMSASEIIELATRAGIRQGTTVLDLCCGVAGPGRLITSELDCAYLGVDRNPGSVDVARGLAGGRGRFEVSTVPPLPAGHFDVVLLLETLLAFRDKAVLLSAISSALAPGGRFACTVEEGSPLSEGERVLMPEADTVWPVPLPELRSLLEDVGFRVVWQSELTAAHQVVVESLVHAFEEHRVQGRAGSEGRAFDDLLTGHRLWSDWLRNGRVRKFALVAERVPLR